MSQPGTISLERPTPKIATITFSNPPVNLVTGETVTRLHELVAELGGDPGIQVVVFKSGVPDFFLNHFDLAAAADFPVPEGNDAVPSSDSIARSRRPMAAAGRGTPAALLPGLVPAAEGSLDRHVAAFGDRLDRPYPPEDDPPG